MKTAALSLVDRATVAGAALPPLLVEAHRIAATVIMGVHGRKQAGPGESFWQYRPYSFGDNVQRIDWHKSGRSERVYIRENEWEAANTLWLWASAAPSMNFQSPLANVTKRNRAQLIVLALAAIAVRAHERVAALGSPFTPAPTMTSLNRMAQWLLSEGESAGLPARLRISRYSTLVLAGDFLDPPEKIAAQLSPIAAEGAMGHLVQICDPAEETLPYDGRVEFKEMAGPRSFIAGKTENLREAYIAKFQAQRAAVKTLAGRLGWSFAVHRTDEPPTKVLMALHGLVGGAKSRVLAQSALR